MSADLALEPTPPPSLDSEVEPARRTWKSTLASAAASALWQIALLGGLFAIYRTGRLLSAHKEAIAFAHAEKLWELERWLHLPSEVWVQSLILHRTWLVEAANRYYVTAHFPVTIAVLIWLYIRHRDDYRWARALLVCASLPALLIQVGVPVAPPRMMTDHGILDTMAIYGPTSYPQNESGLSNQFAALPSLHVGWAVLLAAVAWRMRHPIARWVLSLHALATTTVVLVTGNHYWIDTILGTALVALAWILLSRFTRIGKPSESTASTVHVGSGSANQSVAFLD